MPNVMEIVSVGAKHWGCRLSVSLERVGLTIADGSGSAPLHDVHCIDFQYLLFFLKSCYISILYITRGIMQTTPI